MLALLYNAILGKIMSAEHVASLHVIQTAGQAIGQASRAFPVTERPAEQHFIHTVGRRPEASVKKDVSPAANETSRSRRPSLPVTSTFSQEEGRRLEVRDVMIILSELAQGRRLQGEQFEPMENFSSIADRIFTRYIAHIRKQMDYPTADTLENAVRTTKYAGIILEVTNSVLDDFAREYPNLLPTLRWAYYGAAATGTITNIHFAAQKVIKGLQGKLLPQRIPHEKFTATNDSQGRRVQTTSEDVASKGHCLNPMYADVLEGQTTEAAQRIVAWIKTHPAGPRLVHLLKTPEGVSPFLDASQFVSDQDVNKAHRQIIRKVDALTLKELRRHQLAPRMNLLTRLFA